MYKYRFLWLLLFLSGCQVVPPSPSVSAPDPLRPSSKNAFLGIQFRVLDNLNLAHSEATRALLVQSVVADSAAAQAGLLRHDLIVQYDGQAVTDEQAFSQYLREQKHVGAGLDLQVLRVQQNIQAQQDGKPLEADLPTLQKLVAQAPTLQALQVQWQQQPVLLPLQAVLGQRESEAQVLPDNARLLPSVLKLSSSDLAQQALDFIDQQGLQTAYDDVLQRFEQNEQWAQGWRLPLVRYLHRAPLQLPAVSEAISQRLLQQGDLQHLGALLQEAGWLLGQTLAAPPPQAPSELTLAGHIDFIQHTLKRTVALQKQAFRRLNTDEQDFLRQLSLYKSDSILTPNNVADNQRLLSLAKKVDFVALLQAAQQLAQLAHPPWLMQLKQSLTQVTERAQHAKVQGELLLKLDTAAGELLIGGAGDNRYETAALIIDLGGNDLYLHQDAPQAVSLILDLQGNDRYNASSDGAQGAGVLGVSLLLDYSGNDAYVAQHFAQGAGLFGVGLLLDAAGNDRYVSRALAQGAGLWGLGVLFDAAGQDTYYSAGFAQGFGSTQSLGLLLDQAGNDHYFATGQLNGSYGQAGVFNGFAQGVGFGLRDMASGGLGFLLDGAGDDEFVAGNFSQGGGYFFAFGLLKNAGSGNDRYVGSRYAQGFAAHSALGALLDSSGDDLYSGYVGALQAAAWDLSAAVLWDQAGNDRYLSQGRFFSLAAAAHNGLAWFIDSQGADEYQFVSGSRIGNNDYHGGHSLSLFTEQGGATDVYNQSVELNGKTQKLSEMEVWQDK